jgi:hypothetical protein
MKRMSIYRGSSKQNLYPMIRRTVCGIHYHLPYAKRLEQLVLRRDVWNIEGVMHNLLLRDTFEYLLNASTFTK